MVPEGFDAPRTKLPFHGVYGLTHSSGGRGELCRGGHIRGCTGMLLCNPIFSAIPSCRVDTNIFHVQKYV